MSKMVVTLPNGRAVSIGAYAAAWRELRKAPADRMYKGFDYFPMAGIDILAKFRSGLDDRINIRGGASAPVMKDGRVYKLWMRARERGALVVLCRYCKDPISGPINPNNSNSRCCEGCRS